MKRIFFAGFFEIWQAENRGSISRASAQTSVRSGTENRRSVGSQWTSGEKKQEKVSACSFSALFVPKSECFLHLSSILSCDQSSDCSSLLLVHFLRKSSLGLNSRTSFTYITLSAAINKFLFFITSVFLLNDTCLFNNVSKMLTISYCAE